ncbi:hypothetical protein ACFQ7M_17970 [Streptomyces massasporeus]
MKANPHMKHVDGRRGYVRDDMDREISQVDSRTVPAITTPGGGISTTASFVTKAGSPGLKSACGVRRTAHGAACPHHSANRGGPGHHTGPIRLGHSYRDPYRTL